MCLWKLFPFATFYLGLNTLSLPQMRNWKKSYACTIFVFSFIFLHANYHNQSKYGPIMMEFVVTACNMHFPY